MLSSQKKNTANWKHKLKAYIVSIFDIRGDTMSHEELREMMMENTVIRGSNMWILMLAILIASIGLNVNSTAVIIGAMLISPLMSGILTMGYSLAIHDLTMLRHAFERFMVQVIISFLTSALYFLITPLDVPTSEMIARTEPTLWDVLIALFGGIAGMIGNTRQKKSNVIPGVAIATALMPPLCTAGYGLATLQPTFLFGALYLFVINTLFIMLSAAIVTRLLHIPYRQNPDAAKEKHIHKIVVAITVITVIPSVLTGVVTVYETVSDQNVSRYLSEEFSFDDTVVVQSSTDYLNRKISVSIVGASLSDDVIKRLEQQLEKYDLDGYTLHITQSRTSDEGNTDKVTIALLENENQQLQQQLEEQQEEIEAQKAAQEETEKQLAERTDYSELAEKAEEIFTKLTGCSCGIMSGQDGDYVLLSASEKSTLTEEEKQAIRNWLKTESGISDVRLQINTQ